jgi:hypothetical protein
MTKNMTNRATSWLASAALAALAPMTASTASAGLFETRSNYVGSNWVDGWKDPANWAGLPAYATQAPDGGADINYISMAHDNSCLYININQATDFAFNYGDVNVYFDTDLNASTGNTTDSWWWNDPTRVGADRSMYGAAIWKSENSSWDGTSVDNWQTYGNHNNFLIQISLSKLNNTAAFNWVGRMFGGAGADDYYPRSTTNDFNRYIVATPSGATANFTAASGNYVNGSNWSTNALPTLADTVTIGNGGIATVNTSALNGGYGATVNVGAASGNGTLQVLPGGDLFVRNSLRLGTQTGTGTVNQTGGNVRVDFGDDKNLRIGYDAGGTGYYNLSGGTLAVGDSMTVGKDGHGVFTMTGGAISKAGFITVGRTAGTSAGTFIMSGGTVNQSFGDFEVGNFSAGTAILTGGTFNVAPGRAFAVGNRAGGVGNATIGGTALVTMTDGGDLFIGGNDNATPAGGIGTLNITGGEVQDDDDFIIGNFAAGTLNMSGGLVSKSGWIVLGNNTGATGWMTMSGGTINQTFGELQVGDAAPGTLVFSGGTINLAGAMLVANQPGSTGVATLSGGVMNAPSTTVYTNGTVNFTGGKFLAGTMNVAGGQVLLSSGGNKVLKMTDVAVGGGGKIDLNDNRAIIDYATNSPIANVRSLILQGFNGGSWTGNGMTSSAAAAASTSAHKTALGYAEASAINAGSFGGETVDGTSLLVRYTYSGDANIDGTVDLTDFTFLAANFNKGSGAVWLEGDFNYDQKVDLTDFTFLASNFNQSFPADGGGLGSSVPEPTSMFALIGAASGLMFRRRRSHLKD